MNKEEVINKIKKLLTFSEEVEAKFVEAMDTAGNMLSSEGEVFTVGATLSVTTLEGVTVATEGEYSLEDGTVIAVDAEGVILAVTEGTPIEEEVVEEVVEEAMEETPAVTAAIDAPVDELTNKVVDEVAEVTDSNDPLEILKKQYNQLELLVKALVSKLDKTAEASVAMCSIIEKYGDKETAKDLNVIKTTFSAKKEKELTALDAISKLRNK